MARRRRWLYVLLALAALGAVALFVMFGPPGVAEWFARPEFCASCHPMQPQYDAWAASGHRGIICNDCHLPNDNVIRHYAWDAYFGARDVYLYNAGQVPETIRAYPRTRAFLMENCLRCHDDVAHAARIEGRVCWECHRVLYHRIQLLVTDRAEEAR